MPGFQTLVGTTAVGVMLGSAALGVTADAPGTRTQQSGPILPARTMSEGVLLLTHHSNSFAKAPQYGLQAAITLTDDGRFDPTMANSVALQGDGRVVAFSTLQGQVAVFDRTGKGSTIYGRKGQGPGEFSAAFGVGRLNADTLWIPDIGNAKIEFVVPDRGLVGNASVQGGFKDGAGRPAGVLHKNMLVLFASGLVRQGLEGATSRPLASIVVLDRRTSAQRVIARIPDLEIAATARGPEVRRLTRTAHAVVWDSLIVTGSGEGYRLDLRRETGQIVSRLEVAMPRQRVTAVMREAAIAEALERATDSRRERPINIEDLKRQIREAPFVDSLAPYSGLFVTPKGQLWVVDPIGPGQTSWGATAFRSDGAIVGRLTSQTAGQPMAFGDDKVVVRTESRDGLGSLLVYTIVPKRAGM